MKHPKPAGSTNKRRRGRSGTRATGIRETDEARALLQRQLHSLYWWVFNACKIKGFIRAKGLDLAESESEQATPDKHAAGAAAVSLEDQER